MSNSLPRTRRVGAVQRQKISIKWGSYYPPGPQQVFGLARSILKLQEQEEMKERELMVQKWITQLLSEMSDRWFFEDKDKTDIYTEIKAQSLQGNRERSEKDKFQLAINHQPVDARIETWTSQMVMFSLDAELMSKYNGRPRLWVSLLLNGNETNALPFTVEPMGKEKQKEAPVEVPEKQTEPAA